MKTLDEHNADRADLYASLKEQAARDRKAGILCPLCKEAGHEVQMDKDGVIRSSSGRQPVICPECGHSGEML